MESLGWRAVDVCASLCLSKASVSKILSGDQSPREQTLELFRRVAAEKKSLWDKPRNEAQVRPEPYILSGSDRSDLHKKLDQLADNDPAGLDSVRLLVDGLHQRINTSETLPGEDPVVAKVARALAPIALAKVLREDREDRQKRKAASPNGSTAAPGGGADRKSK